MEKQTEIENALGATNLELLLSEVKSGKIKIETIKMIALKMHDEVHGIFVYDESRKMPIFVMRLMLDKWFVTDLCNDKYFEEQEFALEKLRMILDHQDVGLCYLARMLKAGTVKKINGLPTTHFQLPAEHLTTGTSPTVSDQFAFPLCASHAVGNALVSILDDQ